MGGRPAAGGGRWVEVAPERLPRWLDNFASRHGSYRTDGLAVVAEDGATAELQLPVGVPKLEDLGKKGPRIGLLLARKGAVAVGIADGDDLVASKVDTHYVQGRTAAGGWSQHRFARRRDNQAKAAAADGAAIAGRILLPEVRTLAALVCGGDRAQIDAILAAPPLAPLAALRTGRLLDVPEPRHAVLVAAIAQARAVRILIRDAA
jgi:hypothetical protein